MSDEKVTSAGNARKASRTRAVKKTTRTVRAAKQGVEGPFLGKEAASPRSSVIEGKVMYVPIKGNVAPGAKVAVLKKPVTTRAKGKNISRSEAHDFLTRAGVLDAKGNLRSVFRSSSK